MRSPSAVRTSSPTMMTVRPSGAASRARSAPSIRSWSVIARCVNPRVAAALTTATGARQAVEAAAGVAMEVDEGGRAPPWSPATPLRSAGPGTS